MNIRYLFIIAILSIVACKSKSKEKPIILEEKAATEEKAELPEIRTAKDLIEHSVYYHDPHGNWKNFKSNILSKIISWKTKEESTRKIYINNQDGVFKCLRISDKVTIESVVDQDTCYRKIIKVVSEEEANRYKKRLNCKSAKWDKNINSYLFGLPMKLLDPEAIINDTIFERTYNDIKYDVVKVNYEPLDKKRVWYFYFDQKSHVFKLCKFTSREDENKGGEYIIYNNEVEIDGMKLFGQQVILYNKRIRDTVYTDNISYN